LPRRDLIRENSAKKEEIVRPSTADGKHGHKKAEKKKVHHLQHGGTVGPMPRMGGRPETGYNVKGPPERIVSCPRKGVAVIRKGKDQNKRSPWGPERPRLNPPTIPRSPCRRSWRESLRRIPQRRNSCRPREIHATDCRALPSVEEDVKKRFPAIPPKPPKGSHPHTNSVK